MLWIGKNTDDTLYLKTQSNTQSPKCSISSRNALLVACDTFHNRPVPLRSISPLPSFKDFPYLNNTATDMDEAVAIQTSFSMTVHVLYNLGTQDLDGHNTLPCVSPSAADTSSLCHQLNEHENWTSVTLFL